MGHFVTAKLLLALSLSRSRSHAHTLFHLNARARIHSRKGQNLIFSPFGLTGHGRNLSHTVFCENRQSWERHLISCIFTNNEVSGFEAVTLS